MPDIQVGFEEDDEWESRPDQREDYGTTEDDGVTGTDPHEVVTVSATPTGQVTTVRIAEHWRDKIGPDQLGPGVMAAANATTMAALARQVEAPRPAAPAQPAANGAPDDDQDSPDPQVTAARLSQLADDALAEARQFLDELGPVVTGSVSARSGGRHVEITSQRGQITRVSIDPRWASVARHTEIASEVVDALRRLQARMSPAELAQGPQGPAISELNRLISDPAAMLRQLGL